MRVMTFHVSGGAGNDRLARNAARRLRSFRQRVNLRHDDELRLAAPPLRPYVGGHPCAALLDLEADIFERLLEKPGALEFLHAKLAEIVERVADHGDGLRIALDCIERILLLLAACRMTRSSYDQNEQRNDTDRALHIGLPIRRRLSP